jgi:serine kinase
MAQNSGKDKINLSQYERQLLQKKGFTVGDPINSGSFSRVCRATYQNRAIAAKIIDLEKTSTDYRFKFLPRELYTMKKIRHSFVITIYDIFTIQNRVFVFMELAEGGDILDLLKDGALTESRAKVLYKQIADALRYIHSMGVAHRDIKCENVLLNRQRNIAKLADFGFSRTCFDNSTGRRLLSDTYCGSAAYVAPEVLKAEPYNAMISDVWSLGVVLFVLLNNRLPFSDSNLKKMLQKQLYKKYEFKNNSLSDKAKDLIDKQLEPNIQARYTMVQVLAHPWLNS